MAKGSFNVLPVVRAWWERDGSQRPLTYFGLPILVGVVVWFLELEADNLGAFLTGSIFFAGMMLNIMFRVYGWAEDAGEKLEELHEKASFRDGWERTRRERRLNAIGRLYDSLTWGTLVSLGLTVALLVLNTESAPAQRSGDLVLTTTVVGILGMHLLLVLLASANRLFIITRHNVKRHTRGKGTTQT